MIAYTPPPKTDSPKVSPGSSGKKKCMPSHWSMYPQVVHGVIEDVIAASKDQELRSKLRKACEVSNAVNTTLRRYYNFARDKLMEVLGGDTGLPSNLKPYVHSKTTYKQLEQLIKNGPQNCHKNQGLEVEEEEDDGGVENIKVWQCPTATVKLPNLERRSIFTLQRMQQRLLCPMVRLATSSVCEVVRKRRHFSGTSTQLREVLTKLLKKRYTGDLER
uniref:Uncharacterized protein n=1 Tax=Ditylenchus dipsaci TaxID=166011 RepID=A0A915D6X8_9BILA